MTQSTLKDSILDDVKSAMKARDMRKLGVIRLITAAIKQREVDERILLDDAQVLAVIDKMLKQRHDSIQQFKSAGRTDLVEQEEFEMDILQAYMPAPLSESEVDHLITEAIQTLNASQPKDMGAVMGYLKPKLQGRADIAAVSTKIKALLK